MINEEYALELKMTYDQLCSYLQNKYGLPCKNYFATKECKSKSTGISRTSEGLFIHHNCEKFLGGNLSVPGIAQRFPFEWQKKENLSYCNYIEHWILHLKLNVNSCKWEFKYPFEIQEFFNSHGFFWIGSDINWLYKNNGHKQKWRNECYLAIQNDFSTYVSIMKSVLAFIKTHYVGDKVLPIFEGAILPFEYRKHDLQTDEWKQMLSYREIVSISEEQNLIIFKYEDDSKGPSKLSGIRTLYNFDAMLEHYINIMASFPDKEIWNTLKELVIQPFSQEENEIANWLYKSKDLQ